MKIKSLSKEANTYILRRFDGVMLIDPAASYEEIILKIKGLKLLGILLTHASKNHFGSIGRFNCPIYLHKDDYFLFVDNLNKNDKKDEKNDFSLNKIDLKLIAEKTELKFIDKTVEVIHTPGHTKGSVCYYYDDKLYTGDTLTIKGPGFSKEKSASEYRLKKSIKMLYDKFKITTTVCPGHGEDVTLLEIRQKNSKVRTILKEK